MPPAGTSSKDLMDKKMENASVSAASENTDDVIIVPVNEDSKKLRQIFSNETSMKILDLLKKESLAAGEVAEKLEIPLTTVKYNIDQMVEHDLVRVQRIKYSEKGRQVKIYEAPEKVIIFAPEKMSRVSLISMLQKYAFAFVAAAFAGFGLNYLYQMYLFGGQEIQTARLMNEEAVEFSDNATVAPAPPAPPEAPPATGTDTITGAGMEAVDAAADGSFLHDTIMSFSDWFFNLMTHHAFWFILGALFVCVVIWLIEYAAVSKEMKSE